MTSTTFAWRNGQFLPQAALTVPVYDAGFVLGATVTEQLRTFKGALFRLDEHLDRFESGLAALAINLPVDRNDLVAAARELAARNHPILSAAGDLGLCIFATPGPYATLAGDHAADGPTVSMHTYPLSFHLWRGKYETGQALVIPQVRQVSAASWSRGIKHRSRLHYYLADQEAQSRQPTARALLLDGDGFVTETSTANLLAFFPGRGLVSPPLERILPGVSLLATRDVASQLGIPWSFDNLALEQLLNTAASGRGSTGIENVSKQPLEPATEILLTSTPWCLLPVTSIDDIPIGTGRPGSVFHQLLKGWNSLVGLDLPEQALAHKITAQF